MTPFAHIPNIHIKMGIIQNPDHVINYRTVVSPLDKKGEPINELVVQVGQDAISTMRSCLAHDKSNRATIPELLDGPFLTMLRTSFFPLSLSYA